MMERIRGEGKVRVKERKLPLLEANPVQTQKRKGRGGEETKKKERHSKDL